MSYAQGEFSSASLSTNENQVAPWNQQEVIYAKDFAWFDPNATAAGALVSAGPTVTVSFTQRELNRKIFVANSAASTVTNTNVQYLLPAAQQSQGCTLEISFVSNAQTATSCVSVFRSGDAAPIMGGTLYIDTAGVDQLISPNFSTHVALSVSGLLQGTKLRFFSTGSAWEVSGFTKIQTATSAPTFST